MNRVLAPTIMHTWCEYGECLYPGVIRPTRCFDLEDQGRDLEDEVEVTHNE